MEGSGLAPIDRFPALDRFPFARAGFVGRAAGVPVGSDRAATLRALDDCHRDARRSLGLENLFLATAEQTHGRGVAVARQASLGLKAFCFPQVDALITSDASIVLQIYVADCCAVYILDPVRRCIGLAHSGRKGTELGVVPATIERMSAEFGSKAEELVIQLSPCIRPPRFEVDFASAIATQCRAAGVEQVFDCGVCTAANLSRYYSYRAELGNTGRMLAFMQCQDEAATRGA